MAEVLIIQCNGYLNSIATALFTAAQLKGLGINVAILFDEAAIAALAGKKFEPSPALAKYATTVFGNLKKMDISADPMDYLKQCKSVGVPLHLCGGWCDLLGVRGKLPPEIQEIEITEAEKLMAEAKRIIGRF